MLSITLLYLFLYYQFYYNYLFYVICKNNKLFVKQCSSISSQLPILSHSYSVYSQKTIRTNNNNVFSICLHKYKNKYKITKCVNQTNAKYSSNPLLSLQKTIKYTMKNNLQFFLCSTLFHDFLNQMCFL